MRFRGEYWFLSNMYHCSVALDLARPTPSFTFDEDAFQAAKCPARADEFTGLDGFAAKKLGRRVPLRPDWEAVKFDVMEAVVRDKFSRHPALMRQLRTVRGDIVEDNTWGDRCWGMCDGTGENRLGKLLMRLRDEGR